MGVVVSQDTQSDLGDGTTISTSITTASRFHRGASHDRFASNGTQRRNIPSRLLEIARDQPGQFWTQLPVVVLTVAYTLSTFVVHRPQSGYSGYWDGWVSNAAGILPVIPIALRAWHSRMRAAWVYLGLGVALYDAGNLIYLFHDQNLLPIPSPAPSDAAYLLSYACFAIGIIWMTQRSYGTGILSIRLDGAVTGLAIAALAAMLWFDSVLKVSGHPLQVIVGMSYPIFDLVLLVALFSGLAPLRYRPNLSTALIIFGMIAFVIGDTIYLNQQAADTYVQGTPLDATWTIALCMLGLAAWPREDRRATPRSQRTLVPQGITFVPIVFGLISVVVLTVSLFRHSSPITSLLAIGALCLVIVRMGVTLHEVRVMEKDNFQVARIDELTGLQNRRYFLEDGESRLMSRDSSRRLVMLLIDLDGFKEINDSLGHACGDELLKIVSARFLHCIEGRGVISRIGGDEFAATCEIDPNDEVDALAWELAKVLDDPITLDGVLVQVGVSVGVAIYPEHGATQAELLRSADVAMYQAKLHRSGVGIYQASHDLNSRERLALTADLRVATESGGLDLLFQPKRDLRTNRVQGVEALVRWPHPTRGLLLPGDFVPLAERVGLIPLLTREVIRMALREAARLDREGHRIQMSVNISHLDLVDSLLPDFIGQVLRESGVPPDRLTLEVTESSLSGDLDRTRQSIDDLRALGIRLAIDDFGVGYSSMSQLLELPVNELKIDMSFVRALATDERAGAVITSMIELARALHLNVVAEGVETSVDLEAVRRLGVDVAQGFFVAHPLTSAQLDDFLELDHSFTNNQLLPTRSVFASEPEIDSVEI